MKRKQMISFVLAGTLSASSLSMYAQPVVTELPQIEMQDGVETTTSPAIEIVPDNTVTEDKPTILPLLPEDYEEEASRPVTLPMTPEDYEKTESVPLEQTQLEVNEKGYTVVQYNEGTLQKTIENLGIEFPEKLKLEGSQLLTEEDFAYIKEYAVYLDLSDISVVDNRIPDYAFSKFDMESEEPIPNQKLLGIILPSSITSIGDFAFAVCTSLVSIDIPDKVTSIGEGSFGICTGLKEVNLPESLTSIGDTAFVMCMSLDSIEIPKGVKFIGQFVFVDFEFNPIIHLKVYKDSVGELYAKINRLSYELVEDKKPLAIEKIDPIQLTVPYTYKDKENLKVYTKLHADNGTAYTLPYELDLSQVNFETEEIQQIKKTISLNEVDILGLDKKEFILTPDTIELTVDIQVIPEVNLEGVIKSISNLEIEANINEPVFLPLVVEVTLPSGEKINLPVEWDTTFYDMNKAGTYILNGEFILPEGIQNPRNLKPQLTVKVIDPSAVTESPLEDFVIDETGKLTAYLGDASYIVIPETVNTIGEQVFMDNKTLKTVVLPSGLKTIENEAFKNATNLKEIVFNEELETIGNSAFELCVGLESVKLPKSLTDLGESAFAGCTNLVGIDLGGNLTTIKETSFANCQSLEYVIGMEKVKTIQGGAFLNCIVLNKINLENVVSIGNLAFYYTDIEELTFNQLETLGVGAFANNGSLRKLDFGDSPLEIISDGAFYGCFNLMEINFPEQLREIGVSAFALHYLEESRSLDISSDSLVLNFPSSLEIIKEQAFYNNNNISEIYINNEVELGYKVFSFDIDKLIVSSNIDSLDLNVSVKEISFLNTVDTINLDLFLNADYIDIPKTVNTINVNDVSLLTNTFIVEENSYAHQFVKENNLKFILKNNENPIFVIKDNVLEKYIGDLNTDIITIPEGVTTIASEAFENITAKEIILPDSLETINKEAFYNVNLDQLTINPKDKEMFLINNFISLSEINTLDLYIDNINISSTDLSTHVNKLNVYTNQETLLEEKDNIPSFYADTIEFFSDTLKTIESYSIGAQGNNIIFNIGLENINPNFMYLEINTIFVPNTVKKLNLSIGVKHIYFEENSSLTEISKNALANNELTIFEIPNSVHTIRNNAFKKGSLERLIIPESVTTIEEDAFKDTSPEFTIVTPKDSVAWQFAQENGIKCIDLEENENHLFEIEGNYLRKYYGNDKIVRVPDGVTTIGSEAFYGNANIEEVYLPDSVTRISNKAFWDTTNLRKIEGNNVSLIDTYSFYSTKNLIDVKFPKLKTINNNAFEYSGIKNFDFSNVVTIGNEAFSSTNIDEIKTGKFLKKMGRSAFSSCSNLKNVDLSDSSKLTHIDDSAFAYDHNLFKVILPEGLKTMSVSAFEETNNIRIKIPSTMSKFTFPIPQLRIADVEVSPTFIIDSNHPYLDYFKGLYDESRILLEIEDELEVVDIEKYPQINVLKGTDKESLSLPKNVRYYLNNGKAVDLSILEWDLSEVDTSQKGSYLVKGKTNLNEILKEQSDNEVLRIIQSQKKFEPLLKINVLSNGNEIVDLLSANEVYREEKVNTPFEALKLPTEATVLLDNNEEVVLTVNWNPLDYNSQQLGEQIFYGTLDLEDQYLNEKDVKIKATVKLISSSTEKPDRPDEPEKPTTPSKPIEDTELSKPIEKPLEVIKPAIHKVPMTKLEPAIISSPLIPLKPAQTAKEELPIVMPPQEEKPLENPIEKPIDKPQDEDTNTQQKVDSINNNIDKGTTNKQPTENEVSFSTLNQEWVEIQPSIPIQTLEDTQLEQEEQIGVPQVPISEEVIINEDSEQPINSFYEQVQKLFPNMSYNTFMVLSASFAFVLIAAVFILVIYINKKRKEKENE